MLGNSIILLLIQAAVICKACFLSLDCPCVKALPGKLKKGTYREDCHPAFKWRTSTATTCLKSHPLVFIGDSRMMQLAEAVQKQVKGVTKYE